MGYKIHAFKGISWIGALSLITKGIGFIELIILAKILLPAQFGAYSVALLALGLLETVTETGVNTVLIQEEKIEEYLSSAWIVSIIRGIIISLILVTTAPLISSFFHSPSSKQILLLISIVPLLRGFINPAVVTFQKQLQFNKNFMLQASILFVDTVTSITLTYIMKSPVGIAIGLITGVIFELIISFSLIKPRPALRYDKKYTSLIFHRGKWITGTAIFDYVFHNLDNIVVGRILGPALLGIYQLGYSIAVTPLEEVGKVFVHVSVPILVKLRDDRGRLRNAYVKILGSVVMLSLPVAIFIMVFPQIFVTILGSKWNNLIYILPPLAALGFVKAIGNTSSAIFLSDRKQKYSTVSTFVNVSILSLTIVPFVVSRGLIGASTSALLSALLTLPVIFGLVWKLLGNSNFANK